MGAWIAGPTSSAERTNDPRRPVSPSLCLDCPEAEYRGMITIQEPTMTTARNIDTLASKS